MSDKQERNREKRNYYLIYTGVFLLCAFVLVMRLLLSGKSNVNSTSDGMSQHYRALIYYSKYLKEIVSRLFKEGRLVIPMWDHSIGEGADIINTLHGYGIGDPIALFAVFVPERYMVAFYFFNALVRMYLGGLFFSMLCFYKGLKNRYGILAGALVYAFCFWALQSFTLHIYFLTPLMFMPLYIYSLERIIEEHKPFLFILTVCVSSMCWMYFFYMEALAVAIYGVLRVLFKYHKELLKGIVELFRILGYAVLGVLMAAVILLPVVMAYTSDSRLAIVRSIPLLYPIFFYERLFTVYVANDFPYDLYMGFASATLLAVGLLFKEWKKHLLLVSIFVLGFLCVCLPVAGKIFNGFSYVSERWSFIIALPVAYTMALMWEKFRENRNYLAVVQVLVILLSLYSAWSRTLRGLLPVGLCVLFYVLSVFGPERKIGRLDLRQSGMILLIIVNFLFIYLYNLSPNGGNVINDLLSLKGAVNLADTHEASMMKDYFDGDEFFRYDSNHFTNNDSISSNVNSVNYYWSITNPADQKFRLLLGIRDRLNWQLNGYDQRSVLDTLANVRYYIVQDGYDETVPHGFEYLETKGKYRIFENRYTLPFAYSYEKTLSYEDWYSLNSVEKQEAMLEYVVVEGGGDVYRNDDVSLPEFEITAGEGVSVSDGMITVENKKGTVTLKLKKQSDLETYLSIDGLEYLDDQGLIEDDHTIAVIEVATDPEDPSYLYHMTMAHRYNFNKHDYVTCLGKADGFDEIVLTFQLPGTYVFDGLYLTSVGRDSYEGKLNSLKKDHLEDVVFDVNEIKGTISLDEEKYVLFAVPYSKGWKAYADGNETEALKADEHYLAVKVGKGEHSVELKYATPGLKAGAAVSALSWIGFLAALVLKKRRENRQG